MPKPSPFKGKRGRPLLQTAYSNAKEGLTTEWSDIQGIPSNLLGGLTVGPPGQDGEDGETIITFQAEGEIGVA